MGRTSDDTGRGTLEELDETLSGLGIWTGLMPVADRVKSEYETDLDKFDLVWKIDRLFERYVWFAKQIDAPRPQARCERILAAPPRKPGAWHRALVELSLIGTARAKVFLERWEPSESREDDLEIDLFRRICIAKCDC